MNKNYWGTLFRMKPTKIVHYHLDRNESFNEISNFLKKEFFLSDIKINKLIKTCLNNRKFIKNYDEIKYSVNIYISIPYCITKCHYCTFPSNLISQYKNSDFDLYFNSLENEISSILKILNQKNIKVSTIYFGGGTPSSVDFKYIDKIFNTLKKYVDLQKLDEFTFEAGRADTLTFEKLQFLKENYVSRICLNAQTFNEKILKKINRPFNIDNFLEIYDYIKKLNFNSINIDLIAGFYEQSIDNFKFDINKCINLNPTNITLHTLFKKKTSYLNKKEYFKENLNEDVSKMIFFADDILEKSGYLPYYLYRQRNFVSDDENSGYSLKNYESKFNIAMIEERENTIGFGVYSFSKLMENKDFKFKIIINPKDLITYNKNIINIINTKKERIEKIYGI